MRVSSRAVLAPLLALGIILVLVAGISLASDNEAVDPAPVSGSALPAPAAPIGEGSVRIPRPGISGAIAAAPELADLDGDGSVEVSFGTTNGFYIVGKDGIEQHIGPLAPVSEFTQIADISNDETDDFVIAVSDTQFPNIRAYDSVTGEEIWSYRPAQVTFANNLMWTNQQTLTFDLSVDDLDGDGVEEVLATSGYRLYALDASNGELRWHYEWRDNLWKSTSVDDFTGDGNRDVLVGSQDGYLIGVDGESGEESWKTHLVQDYKAFDESGSPWKDIPQGVWDIVPLPDGENAVVTSEDGYVRLVSVTDGRVSWEHKHITHIDAALSMYYNQKSGQPTSPGDIHFFNLRAQVVPDATGDGRDNLLVTSYLGAGRMEDPRQATLFILDISTGAQIWKKQIGSIALSKKVAVFENAGERYVIVPGSDFVALKLADGRPADSKVLDSLGLSKGFEQDSGYSLISLESNGSVVMSDGGDILWNQNGGQRRIPRTTRNRLFRVDLVGDEVPDVLVIAGSGGSSNFGTEPRDRLIYVLDGSTGLLAWEYEPSAKLIAATEGLAGVKVGPDLNGDGRPDLLAYAQDPSEFQGRESDTQGEASRVIVLSGIDGTEILAAPVAEGTYYGIWEDFYLESGSLEKIIRDELIKSRAPELEEQWEQGERENRINGFTEQFENRWNEFVWLSMEGKSAELESGGGGGDGGYLDEEQQAQIDEQWGHLEAELTQRFENSLQNEADILRSLEVGESTIASYQLTRREGFSDEIENERAGAYEQWANEYDGPTYNREELLGEYEAELQNERERTEQEWLDEYMVALESEKHLWMNESMGDIDNQVAEQVEQWTQEGDDQKNWRRIDKRVVSVSPIRFPGTKGEFGLFVATGRGFSVLDISGEVIWSRTQDPNVYSTPMGTNDVEKYGVGIEYESHRPVGVIEDINDDGIDDLRFLSQGSMFFATSFVKDGEINYRAGERFQGPAGDDGNGDATEIDDLNGDGVRDVALFHWVENAPPEMRILSGADGSKLLDISVEDPNSVNFKPTSDFNDDGVLDLVLFERWVEGSEGPRISILDGRSGDAIWVYNDLKDSYMFDQMGINADITPIAPVGDLTGDGVDEVAIVRHLTWQPGASLLVIDTTNDEIVKEIVTEPTDSERGQEERWHPGLLVADIGDLNGDGQSEIGIVNAFGQTEKTKRYRLVVIDLEAESVIADFRTVGTKLIPLDEAGLLGLVGIGGEVYTLDVSSELTITAPAREVNTPGPVTVSWSGAPKGSFNQVIVDNLVVARTNDSSVELNLAAGEHSITIRSMDPSGRGIRATATTTVTKSSSTFILLYVFTFGSVILALVLPSLRWWSRRSFRAGNS